MNSMSWLLYLAGVTQGISILLFSTGLVCIGVTAIVTFVRAVEENPGPAYKWLIPVGLVLMLLASFIPDRQTIYMIAASEIGEEVITNPEVADVARDAMRLLKQQIAEHLSETEE